MNPRRFYHSLRFKITAGVIAPLLIILAGFSYLQYTVHRHLMMDNLRVSASNWGEIIEGSLQHAMLTNDFLEIQQIMDEIAKRKRIKNLFLLDKKGRIAISAAGKKVGMLLDLADPTCQVCHRYEAVDRNLSVIFTTEEGERVFRNLKAVDNREECRSCHDPQDKISGVLITDFSMTDIDRHLAADRRNSLLWSAGAILIIVLTVNFMMSRMVINKLERFVEAIKSLGKGDLDQRVMLKTGDEIEELADSFNRMADGLKEKERLERRVKERTKELEEQTERLSTLNTIAATVSQSLNLEEIMGSALGKVLELTKLRAGWILLQDGEGQELQLAAYRGLSEEFAREEARRERSKCICQDVLDSGQTMVLENMLECPQVSSELIRKEGLAFHVCVPLKSKDKVLGIVNLAGDAHSSAQSFPQDALEVLTAVGRQIGIAVENARLYEELHRKEALRGQLLKRVITAQEEERKRIARELHDETSQALTSLKVGLKALEGATSLDEVRSRVDQLRAIAARTLDEVHDLAFELRPRILDDLGLVAALQRYTKDYVKNCDLDIDFQATGLEGKRLSPQVETTIYRIVQEALTNVVRHARAQNVSVLLEIKVGAIVAIIEDDGQGFDVEDVLNSRGLRKLGLYGMQERASLVGGKLTIESASGLGTTIFVEIPLEEAHGSEQSSTGGKRHGKNTPTLG